MNEKEGSSKSFWQGLATGLGIALVISLITYGGVTLYRGIQGYRSYVAAQEEKTIVADEHTLEKIGVLEETIEEYFWKDVSAAQMEEGVYKGLLDSLEDPYSVYYTHEELLELQEQTEGIYYGIGAYISQDLETGSVQISKIIKDTPAEESELQPGDYIYMINGEEMYGQDSSYVVSKIKGEEGTFVTITVLREGVADPIDIDVERRKIESPTVEYEMLDNGMAYIQIVEFDMVTTEQFENAYKKINLTFFINSMRVNEDGTIEFDCTYKIFLPEIPFFLFCKIKFFS